MEIEPDALPDADHDAVYLSPHLDDVAYSVPGALLSHDEADDSVLEVVFFSHCSSDAPRATRERYERRRDEERRAARRGGWDVCFAEFTDAPFRSHAHRNFNEFVWGTSPDDYRLVGRLAVWVQGILEEIAPATCAAPLGVGRHIDHRLLHRAARRAGREADVDLGWYEDRPYALVPEGVALRLGELGVEAAPDLDRFFDHFWEAPYVAAHLDGDDARRDCRRRYEQLADDLRVAGSSTDHPALEARAEHHVREPDDRLWSLPAAHESQIEPFLGSMDRFREDSRAYADRLDVEGPYVERRWRLIEA